VENEEVKYFAIIRWETGPLLDVCVCVYALNGVCIDTARVSPIVLAKSTLSPWNAFGYLFSPAAQVAQRSAANIHFTQGFVGLAIVSLRAPRARPPEESKPDGGLNF
jgi:hypothetical protein